MSMTFFKWVQYLERKEIGKFLDLYSKSSILVTKITNITSPNIDIPFPDNNTILHNRVGVFKNFEKIFFSTRYDFKILHHDIEHSNGKDIITGKTNFIYKSNQYFFDHNIVLEKENKEKKITYHNIGLQKDDNYLKDLI